LPGPRRVGRFFVERRRRLLCVFWFCSASLLGLARLGVRSWYLSIGVLFFFRFFFHGKASYRCKREWTPLDTSFAMPTHNIPFFFFFWLLSMEGKWEVDSMHCIQELPYIDYTKHNDKYVDTHSKGCFAWIQKEDKSLFSIKATVLRREYQNHHARTYLPTCAPNFNLSPIELIFHTRS